MSKTLDRLASILARAEDDRTPPAERETALAMAQRISTATGIDLARARAHQKDRTKREQPEVRKVQVGDSLRTKGNGWRVELMSAIAEPNDVRLTIGGYNINVWLHGFPSDMDVVEKLYAIAVTNMVSEADAALKRGDHKQVKRVRRMKRVENPEYVPEDERYWMYPGERSDPMYARKTIEVPDNDADGNPVYVDKVVSEVDGRVWRANFYRGYISRLRSRLWEARREALRDAGVEDESSSTGTAVVLRDKRAEVDDFFKEETKTLRGTWTGPKTSDYSDNAREAGQQAAARTRLDDDSTLGANERRQIGGG